MRANLQLFCESDACMIFTQNSLPIHPREHEAISRKFVNIVSGNGTVNQPCFFLLAHLSRRVE